MRRAGVGPAPCPVAELTAKTLTAKFDELHSSDVRARAAKLAAAMAAEDGVGAAVRHFTRHFPVHDALCDVSLLLASPQTTVARFVLRPNRGSVVFPIAFMLVCTTPLAVAGFLNPFDGVWGVGKSVAYAMRCCTVRCDAIDVLCHICALPGETFLSPWRDHLFSDIILRLIGAFLNVLRFGAAAYFVGRLAGFYGFERDADVKVCVAYSE